MKSSLDIRADFSEALGLQFEPWQTEALLAYADLVWEKHSTLNLTSVKDKQEIWDRHILDGLVCASLINKISAQEANFSGEGKSRPALKIADFGAGAGYIGFALQIALAPRAEVTLIESLERRCGFLQWVIFKLAPRFEAFKRARVLRLRANADNTARDFDFTTERAMGELEDVLPVCCSALKAGGYFIAYQTQEQQKVLPQRGLCAALGEDELCRPYVLPSDDKGRKLVVFRKAVI